MVYYDPERFAEARVPLPHAGWDFDELLQTCAQLWSGQPSGSVPVDIDSAGGLMIWAALVAGYRDSFLDGEGCVPAWDDGVAQAMAAYVGRRNLGRPQPQAGAVGQAGPALWFALFQPGDWATLRSGQVGLVGIPAVRGRRAVPFFPLGHGMATGALAPQRSLDFFAWLLSPAGQGFVTSQGWLPARTDLAGGSTWFPVPPGPRLDAGALVVPAGERWWAPAPLWTYTAGPAA